MLLPIFCGGYKNNFRLQFFSSFKKTVKISKKALANKPGRKNLMLIQNCKVK